VSKVAFAAGGKRAYPKEGPPVPNVKTEDICPFKENFEEGEAAREEKQGQRIDFKSDSVNSS